MWSQGTILQVLQWTNECWHRCEPHLIPAVWSIDGAQFEVLCPVICQHFSWLPVPPHSEPVLPVHFIRLCPLIWSQSLLSRANTLQAWRQHCDTGNKCSKKCSCASFKFTRIYVKLWPLPKIWYFNSFFFLITNKQLESCLLVVFWLVGLFACFVKP